MLGGIRINEFNEYIKSNPIGNLDAFRISYYKEKLPKL